jgi:twitching motility protein PilT
VAVHEILVGSPALASMIRENKTFQILSLMQAGQAQGMQTMDMALERLVRAKEIAVETALAKAIDKEGFGKLLKQSEMAPL